MLAEETDFEINFSNFCNFWTSVTLTLDRSNGIPSYITHRPLRTYQILSTSGRMDGLRGVNRKI